MSDPISGSVVLLKVSDGQGGWLDIGSQTGVKFSEKNAGVKFKSKASHAATMGGGEYSCTASLDALFVPNDAGLQALKDAIRNGTLVTVEREVEGDPIETGQFLVTGNDEDFKDEAPATVSVSLTMSGTWTLVAAKSDAD